MPNFFKPASFFIALFLFIITIMPSWSEESDQVYSHDQRMEELNENGSILDPFMEDIVTYAEEALSYAGDKIVSSITNIFSPSYNTILDLENGVNIGFGEQSNYSVQQASESYTIGSIYNFAKYFGIILANLILFFNLAMCMLGKSEQIRDTPVSLVAKYVFSLVFINISFNITVEIINFCSGMWQDVVMNSNNCQVNFSDHFFESLFEVGAAGTIVAVLGITTVNPIFIMATIVIPCVILWLAWKLFKQFLRLFFEIAERYFVMVLLLCFMPAVIPTMISNNTKNILSSYMRMFFCQLFVMLTNTVFMKIFITILLSGGWTAGILNYILALAFMRVCQRIDTYMLTMGLNVAQTGGAVLGAGLGAGRAIGNLLRGFEKAAKFAEKASANSGRKLIDSGNRSMKEALSVGDFKKYSDGFAAVNGGSAPSLQSFLEEQAKTYPTAIDKGTIVPTGGSIEGFNQTAAAMRIPINAASDLSSQGINLQQIQSIKQLDDKGLSFGYYDGKGNGVGYTDKGITKAYGGRANDLEAINKDKGKINNNTPENVSTMFKDGTNLSKQKPLIDNETFMNLAGLDSIDSQERVAYGKDLVTGVKKEISRENTIESRGQTYDVRSVAAYPDIMHDTNYTKVRGADGSLYGYKIFEAKPKNNRVYEKNPAITVKENK